MSLRHLHYCVYSQTASLRPEQQYRSFNSDTHTVCGWGSRADWALSEWELSQQAARDLQDKMCRCSESAQRISHMYREVGELQGADSLF